MFSRRGKTGKMTKKEFKERVSKLVDEIDEQTKHKNLTLSKQPPETWSEGERHAWCVGWQEGQINIANRVRTLLAEFAKEVY
jgi:hypothetical protein